MRNSKWMRLLAYVTGSVNQRKHPLNTAGTAIL